MEQILRVFGVIAAMLLVIFAAYFMTKYVAAKANGAGGKARYFRLIDRFSVSKDKMFVLIAVGQSVYLIGVTNQGMTVIDQKELSELPAEEEQTKKFNIGFPDVLSCLKKTKPGNISGDMTDRDGKRFSDFIKEAQQTDEKHDDRN